MHVIKQHLIQLRNLRKLIAEIKNQTSFKIFVLQAHTLFVLFSYWHRSSFSFHCPVCPGRAFARATNHPVDLEIECFAVPQSSSICLISFRCASLALRAESRHVFKVSIFFRMCDEFSLALMN
ncbi:hypothetical protein BpHYR1_004085 [Brachionus plicatilis]|uniref:Uncharacterized protein n=1 Tax=Brachionus plicatilis TaxID=10195 RepID=A0A3M7RN50_BRAPC|nr:hypothetical protein BpHYR1_004085 [Brachionus plicatilis]